MSIQVVQYQPTFIQFQTQYLNEHPSDLIVPVQFKSVLSREGIGGTYFLEVNNRPIAVFKPSDEEPGCVNNPKQQKNYLKEGVRPGEGAIREFLAYLLDRGHFANVPRTKMEEIVLNNVKKFGSYQEFVENEGTMDDYGYGLFSVENIQRIAQFDIRTLNMDRNAGNFLVVDSGEKKKLVPIDHSYILPEKLDGARFDWMYWSQADKPVLPVVKEYVMNIDLEEEVRMLEMMGVSREAVDNFKIATLFLMRACEVNWSFRRMAEFVCKNGEEKTKLEMVAGKVKLVSSDQQSFWFHLMDALNAAVTE